MLKTTSSSKRSVNMLFIGCFLVVCWVVFKDAFRISLLFPIPDIGIVVFIISVLVTFVAFLQGSRYIKLSLFDVIILAYIFYSSMVTVAHSLLHNPYRMSSYQILIVFTLQCLSMFMLWYFSTKSPATLVKVTNSVANFALFSCVLLGVILLFFVMIDLNSVFQFYSELVDLGVIVYPFQASDEGIALRYSGIFNSALNFGMFVVFSIVILLCGGIKGAQKKLILFVLILLLASTLNRNALITFAYISISICLVRVGVQKNIVFLTMLFGLSLIFLLLIFIVNLDGSIDQGDSFILSSHSLYSRFEIWLYWINSLDLGSLFYGYGVIAGMGEEHLYIDNGYIFLILNSGFFSLIFLLVSLCYMTVTGARFRGPDSNLAFFLLLGLPVAMIFNNIVIDPFLMLLFFFYPLALIKKEALSEK
jgi:hypothetical protein